MRGYVDYKLLGDKKYSINDEAYTFYKERANHRDKKKTRARRHLASIIKSIYSKVAEAAIDYEAGVYAPGYFYIIPQPYPSRKPVLIAGEGGKLISTMNSHSEGSVYSLIFVNLLAGRHRRVWDMTNSFFKGVRKKLTTRLKEDEPKYLFALDSLKKVR
jgi:hypothetical protein